MAAAAIPSRPTTTATLTFFTSTSIGAKCDGTPSRTAPAPGILTSMSLSIEAAVPGDVPLVLEFIRELADYENLADRVVATEADLRQWLFGEKPVAEAVIAREGSSPLGFALFFPVFSTFLGRPGIYLEDL